ncbi:hypothetical protein ACHAXA_005627 [Cyclostephanos tholiformis]|uniref:FAM192A/Fyv6 N-terminal domain-containing protein n=1 Tax=Cyclostephanos tholiformis TaxID=382380 RepID=A0ABD3RC94_9STRA
MSLSFIKTAVLSSTDGISHNEETSIDNNETQSLRASGGGGGGGVHRPLFEQLRANRDAEQERDEEFQRSIRGTRALDEEDCAHLDAIERRREEKEYVDRSIIEREVALFYAAREDRGLSQTMEVGGDDDGVAAHHQPGRASNLVVAKKEAIKIVPKFTIKKKRKIASRPTSDKTTVVAKRMAAEKEAENDDDALACVTKGKEKVSNFEGGRGDDTIRDSHSNNEGGGILGLGCYGSDSD